MSKPLPLAELRACTTLVLTRALSDFRHDVDGLRAWATRAQEVLELLRARCPGHESNLNKPPLAENSHDALLAWRNSAVDELHTFREVVTEVHAKALQGGAAFDVA